MRLDVNSRPLHPSGTQGPADGYSSPEHSRRALQPAPLPGAGTLPLRTHLHAGVRRPQDRGAGEAADILHVAFVNTRHTSWSENDVLSFCRPCVTLYV